MNDPIKLTWDLPTRDASKRRSNFAETVTRRGPLFDDAIAAQVIAAIQKNVVVGVDPAAILEEKCGRYIRGKHTGKLRGWATWTFVVKGGWIKLGPGHLNGRVVAPGAVLSVEVTDYMGKPLLKEDYR